MNNISKNLKVTLPKVPVYYQLLSVKPDSENKGRLKMPSSVRIPNIQTIFDPGDDEVKVFKYIVGQRTVSDNNGNTKLTEKLGDIYFYRNSNGMIIIQPKNKKDLPLYQFLEICNENASNPHRDKNTTPLFKRMDKAQDAKDSFEKEMERNEAISLALNMPYEELKPFAEKLKIFTNRDPYEVRMAMKVKAEENPTIFIAKNEIDVKTIISSQIKEAIDKEIIVFNAEENRWMWSQNKALILNVAIGQEKMEALFEFYTENDKGRESFKKVINKL